MSSRCIAAMGTVRSGPKCPGSRCGSGASHRVNNSLEISWLARATEDHAVIRWLALRVMQSLATLVAALVILFIVMHLVPGKPTEAYIGDRPMSEADTRKIIERYCLDCPLPEQFAIF